MRSTRPIASHITDSYLFSVDLPHQEYTMRDFITFIIKNIVDHPDKIILDQEEKEGVIVFRLQVAQGDVGKVIGKQGKHAIALRTLLVSVAAKEGKRVQLEIAD